MSNEVALGAGMRQNLLSLQKTNVLLETTQLRLATGRKVNSALDNPLSFFTAQSLTNRSSDLGRLLDGMGQSISSVKEADKGLTSLTQLIEQAQSVVSQAQDALAGGVGDSTFTGDVNIRDIADLTSLTNVTADDTFDITVGGSTAQTITIEANDSGQDLVDKINSALSGYATAALDFAGQLKITATKAGDAIRISATGGGNDIPLAGLGDIGLSEFVAAEKDGAGNTPAGGTIVAGNTLKSATIAGAKGTDAVNGTFATIASGETIALTLDVNGGSGASGGSTITFNITGAMTIDQMVTNINDTANGNDGSVTASFDANRGQIVIETSSQVETLSISQAASDSAATSSAFGFGTGASDANTGDNAAGSSEFIKLSGSEQIRTLEKNYNELQNQIDALVDDANYRGINLLYGDVMTTYFNEDRSNSLETVGKDLTSAGLGLRSADFGSTSNAEAAAADVRGALNSARDFGTSLANSLSILQSREDFTKETMQVLDEGADKLTLADENEEGARMLALQTRLQLGVTSLSLAAQSQQSVLSLF